MCMVCWRLGVLACEWCIGVCSGVGVRVVGRWVGGRSRRVVVCSFVSPVSERKGVQLPLNMRDSALTVRDCVPRTRIHPRRAHDRVPYSFYQE